jgi:hypothetical protein
MVMFVALMARTGKHSTPFAPIRIGWRMVSTVELHSCAPFCSRWNNDDGNRLSAWRHLELHACPLRRPLPCRHGDRNGRAVDRVSNFGPPSSTLRSLLRVPRHTSLQIRQIQSLIHFLTLYCGDKTVITMLTCCSRRRRHVMKLPWCEEAASPTKQAHIIV